MGLSKLHINNSVHLVVIFFSFPGKSYICILILVFIDWAVLRRRIYHEPLGHPCWSEGKYDIKWKHSKGLWGLLWSMINCHWQLDSSHLRRIPQKILWRGKKTQPAYELTIRRHGKASLLPHQPDHCIHFNQSSTNKLRLESSQSLQSVPNTDSSNSSTSVKSRRVPGIIIFNAVPVKPSFLVSHEL